MLGIARFTTKELLTQLAQRTNASHTRLFNKHYCLEPMVRYKVARETVEISKKVLLSERENLSCYNTQLGSLSLTRSRRDEEECITLEKKIRQDLTHIEDLIEKIDEIIPQLTSSPS